MNSSRDYYYEEIGENFDQWMSDYDVQRRTLLIQRHLGQRGAGKSCLEVGSGTGKISRAIIGSVGALTVSDISEKLAGAVGAKLNCAAMRQDACALSVADNSFEVLVSSECIEHSPDPSQALREMARVLKPGGLLIVTTPNRMWYPILWLSMALGVRKFSGREVWMFPWQAASVLRDAGMREIKLDGCHLFPWQIPLAKKVLPLFDRIGKLLYPVMINFCVTAVKKP
jgi:ubiquinone/menaquinone biosynthesis C-methylase UbiE